MKRIIALVVMLLTVGVVAAAQQTEKTNETITLCIPHVATSSGERIVGFEIEVTSA